MRLLMKDGSYITVMSNHKASALMQLENLADELVSAVTAVVTSDEAFEKKCLTESQ